MTPTTDDNGSWLEAAGLIIGALWAALGVLYWRLWNTLATREWVVRTLGEYAEKDAANDRQLFTDLIEQHTVKIGAKLDEILRTVKKNDKQH